MGRRPTTYDLPIGSRGDVQPLAAIVAATALQIAARSVAEKMGIPYVFAAYCPAVLPSVHHAPPELPPVPGAAPIPATSDNRELWARSAERFNATFAAALNAHRAAIGLTPARAPLWDRLRATAGQ